MDIVRRFAINCCCVFYFLVWLHCTCLLVGCSLGWLVGCKREHHRVWFFCYNSPHPLIQQLGEGQTSQRFVIKAKLLTTIFRISLCRTGNMTSANIFTNCSFVQWFVSGSSFAHWCFVSCSLSWNECLTLMPQQWNQSQAINYANCFLVSWQWNKATTFFATLKVCTCKDLVRIKARPIIQNEAISQNDGKIRQYWVCLITCPVRFTRKLLAGA